jgi:hypothetical protein
MLHEPPLQNLEWHLIRWNNNLNQGPVLTNVHITNAIQKLQVLSPYSNGASPPSSSCLLLHAGSTICSPKLKCHHCLQLPALETMSPVITNICPCLDCSYPETSHTSNLLQHLQLLMSQHVHTDLPLGTNASSIMNKEGQGHWRL